MLGARRDGCHDASRQLELEKLRRAVRHGVCDQDAGIVRREYTGVVQARNDAAIAGLDVEDVRAPRFALFPGHKQRAIVVRDAFELEMQLAGGCVGDPLENAATRIRDGRESSGRLAFRRSGQRKHCRDRSAAHSDMLSHGRERGPRTRAAMQGARGRSLRRRDGRSKLALPTGSGAERRQTRGSHAPSFPVKEVRMMGLRSRQRAYGAGIPRKEDAEDYERLGQERFGNEGRFYGGYISEADDRSAGGRDTTGPLADIISETAQGDRMPTFYDFKVQAINGQQ